MESITAKSLLIFDVALGSVNCTVNKNTIGLPLIAEISLFHIYSDNSDLDG